MRIQILALLLGTFLVSWGTAAGAGDLVVICNTSVSLKADEVRDVYFGDNWMGAHQPGPASPAARRSSMAKGRAGARGAKPEYSSG